MHAPRPGPGGHSLAELALVGAGRQRDGVEVGWRVSPELDGDRRPHLFVHRWREGAPCWSDCGFTPWSARWAPGDALDRFQGAEVSMALAVTDGRWWIWFDGEWLGFFEAASWAGRLDIAASAQWFGEVFSPGAPVAGEMGNGRPGTDPDAATVSGLCQVLPDTWSCLAGMFVFPLASEPASYSVRLLPDGLRYGGTAEPLRRSSPDARTNAPASTPERPGLRPRPPPGSASEETPSERGRSAPSPPR